MCLGVQELLLIQYIYGIISMAVVAWFGITIDRINNRINKLEVQREPIESMGDENMNDSDSDYEELSIHN